VEFTDNIVEQYAKKILGFAYSKTRNVHQAEDLAQEILCELMDSLSKRDEIDNMDAFVYTISRYTWSNFLRRNKRHWNNVDLSHDLRSGQNVEAEAMADMLGARLRVEIAYLSALHRKITVLFYFETETSANIAKLLGIPHSTVRWHLGKIKKKLKVGMEMKEIMYEPRRLMGGLDGYSPHGDRSLRGIGKNRLVDNICLACYGNALTIEKVARTLSVATAYIEDAIHGLVEMDYLRVVEKNKYSTTFFISTLRHGMITAKYHYHNIGLYAEKVHGAFSKRYDAIRDIGFLGSDQDRDFVLWALMPLVLNDLYYKSVWLYNEKNKIVRDRPKRADGSEFWVCATLCDDQYYNAQTEFTAEEVIFRGKSTGNGIKSDHDDKRAMLQLESCATIEAGFQWRNFGVDAMMDLHRIVDCIRGGNFTELDKEVFARQAEQGYVQMVDGQPKMMIPFLTKVEHDKLQKILDEIIVELGEHFFVDYIEKFAEMFAKELPEFISKGERDYHASRIYPQYAVLYWLAGNGLLRYPSVEEAKRLCTVVWCTE